jgi:hypothetical protein
MKHRFKSLEIGIFSVVSLVFLNSVYGFLSNGHFLGIRRLASSPKPVLNRSVSSELESFTQYETTCHPAGEVLRTQAAKIRVVGAYCGASSVRQVASVPAAAGAAPPVEPLDYRVENASTHYLATVFTDHEAQRFSTDFIPLNPGSNKILMDFKYRSGKTHTVVIEFIRN